MNRDAWAVGPWAAKPRGGAGRAVGGRGVAAEARVAGVPRLVRVGAGGDAVGGGGSGHDDNARHGGLAGPRDAGLGRRGHGRAGPAGAVRELLARPAAGGAAGGGRRHR